MKKKQIKFLKEIVETPSPTGSETQVAEIVRERLVPIADEIRTDTMGSVQATYEGWLHDVAPLNRLKAEMETAAAAEEHSFDDEAEFAEDQDFASPFASAAEEAFDAVFDSVSDSTGDIPAEDPADAIAAAADEGLPAMPPLRLMLAAHMDEVGLMVTYISDDGFLSVSSIGGVDAAILPGMRVDVHTAEGRLRGVVGRKPIHLIDADDRKVVTPLDKLVIDLGMPAKKVKKAVRVGDSITYGVGFERFGKGMAVSRAFDDKVGVFITCLVMERLASNDDYNGIFTGAITVQEEIGTRGAMTSAHSVMPDVALAFDVTHATDYPGIDKSKYGKIVCGGGPVIARGPNINPVVFERLVAAAEALQIPYQIEAEPSVTGTDARAIQVTREGIPTGLVSVPLRYMHTPTEVINLDDVENTVKLIERFALDLEDATDFVPGHPMDYMSVEKLESLPLEDDYFMLTNEVEQLTEDVADLQALAEGVPELEYAEYAEGVLTPENAPFGRQQELLSAEFASLDLDAKADEYAASEDTADDVAEAMDVITDEEAAERHALETNGVLESFANRQPMQLVEEDVSSAELAEDVEDATDDVEATEAAEAPVAEQLNAFDPIEGDDGLEIIDAAAFADSEEGPEEGEYAEEDAEDYGDGEAYYEEDGYEDDEYEDEDDDEYEDDEYYDDDDDYDEDDYEDDDFEDDDDDYEDDDFEDDDDYYYDDDEEYEEDDEDVAASSVGGGPSVHLKIEQDGYYENAAFEIAKEQAQQATSSTNMPIVNISHLNTDEE